MRRLLKVQREWAFIDAHLLFRRKSVQKSTAPSKLVEIFPYSGGLVKFPPETNVSTLEDNFQGSKNKWNLCLLGFLIICQSLNAGFPGMALQFHILLSSWDHVVTYSWKNHWPREGRRRWVFLGMAWKGGDPHCFYITDDTTKGKAHKHVQIRESC